MTISEVWVKRADLRTTRRVEREAAPLAPGEARLAIDKFALTANNVSYAVSGDFIGYWKFFPAEGEWGKVPVWGFADVVESRCDGLPVGERIWGFFPIATEITVKPAAITPERFFDGAEHRAALPSLYNLYQRTSNDPPALKAREDERCLLFPLFATSFVLYDYLIDNALFGAKQILIGSASSKTGFGLAYLLKHDKTISARIIGLTSRANIAFVQDLAVCDEVKAYDEIASIDPGLPAAFIDMSGSAAVISSVHERLGDNVKESCLVGATHWDANRSRGELAGAKPKFFFAPAHIAKRDKEWGEGAVMARALEAGGRIAAAVAGQIDVDRIKGPAAVETALRDLIANKVPPRRGLMLSMKA